ncbi:hypothetical protein, partial [Trueperella sp.]|uniref:hypothetical protein n=1 Tax=Trueperella sp. TaxID=2699835 RepID=UPI0037362FE1
MTVTLSEVPSLDLIVRGILHDVALTASGPIIARLNRDFLSLFWCGNGRLNALRRTSHFLKVCDTLRFPYQAFRRRDFNTRFI